MYQEQIFLLMESSTFGCEIKTAIADLRLSGWSANPESVTPFVATDDTEQSPRRTGIYKGLPHLRLILFEFEFSVRIKSTEVIDGSQKDVETRS